MYNAGLTQLKNGRLTITLKPIGQDKSFYTLSVMHQPIGRIDLVKNFSRDTTKPHSMSTPLVYPFYS